MWCCGTQYTRPELCASLHLGSMLHSLECESHFLIILTLGVEGGSLTRDAATTTINEQNYNKLVIKTVFFDSPCR